MPLRQLFGGAITVELEGNLIDASELRQVPDNQEVLLGLDDNTTIIVEVLESVKEGKTKGGLQEAIRFHFSSLAHDNSASSSEVKEIFSSPIAINSGENGLEEWRTPMPLLLIGEQKIKKFGREKEPEDQVRIYLALWRLTPQKDVDLILTINEPIVKDTQQSEKCKETFMRAARTLQIRDWKLFA